ncbi:MAG: hypothetical protein E7421_02580 [Ruminococcaceae bacterium]|nr:hypothetical protein [Oscillospiraceae bacterium]
MRRLWLFLLVALLLVGCGRRQPQPEATESTPPAEETQGLYVPDSPVEQQTGGAVRPYSLRADTYFDLAGMGANLLVVGQKGLMVLAGEQGEVMASLETGDITPVSVVDTAVTGMAYYVTTTRQVNVLNPQLKSVTQLTLPETIVGKPVISLTKNEIYYSTGNEIRALHMNTGISRLLRQQTVAKQSLMGAYFDGAVLLCQMTDESGNTKLEYISSESGQTLSSGQGLSNLQTHGNEYFVYWQDGVVHQSVYGTRGAEAKSFLPPAQPEGKTVGRVSLPAMHGIVEYVETESGLELTYYDMQSGKRTAQVTVPGMQLPTKLHTDGTYIWILTADESYALYRWDITKSPVEDETVYTGTLYTAQNPDTQGLAECRLLADEYEKLYGVKLLLWEDAVKRTGSHSLTAEYHTHIIKGMLEKLQPLISQFPEKFLQKTVEKGWIQIAFVQTIDGDKDWVQFWEEGDSWVLVSAKADVVDAVLQGMAYAIDSRVLGNSRDFDNWDQLNPEGFAYSYAAAAEEKPEYLEGEGKAFADVLSMTYPHEDRCRIFYNAMLPDNAAMFTSPIMKEKLLRLCTGIREAYNLEKKTEVYPWEQYLETSIAYVK